MFALFHSDPAYQRPDNFVDINLLEGWTWENTALQLQASHRTTTITAS